MPKPIATPATTVSEDLESGCMPEHRSNALHAMPGMNPTGDGLVQTARTATQPTLGSRRSSITIFRLSNWKAGMSWRPARLATTNWRRVAVPNMPAHLPIVFPATRLMMPTPENSVGLVSTATPHWVGCHQPMTMSGRYSNSQGRMSRLPARTVT